MQQKAEEIDLRDLILLLWKNKARLLACTLAATLLSICYAFYLPPTYQASSNILPPTPANLSAYNVVALSDDKLPTLDVEEAYRIFLRHLNSGTLKLEFFEEYYLPEKTSSTDVSITEREQLWQTFNGILNITLPTAKSPDLATIKFEDSDPDQASFWANEYVKTSFQRSSQQAVNTLTSAIDGRVQRLTVDISTLRAAAEQDRLNRIARLKEDLILAKSIDLKNPASNQNLIISYNDGTAYLRGSTALEAELALLEARTNNDPFIENLSLLNEQLSLLQALQLSDAPLELASVDSYAITPETPTKPNKRLIVLIGILVGLALGICLVIVQAWWKDDIATK